MQVRADIFWDIVLLSAAKDFERFAESAKNSKAKRTVGKMMLKARFGAGI